MRINATWARNREKSESWHFFSAESLKKCFSSICTVVFALKLLFSSSSTCPICSTFDDELQYLLSKPQTRFDGKKKEKIVVDHRCSSYVDKIEMKCACKYFIPKD